MVAAQLGGTTSPKVYRGFSDKSNRVEVDPCSGVSPRGLRTVDLQGILISDWLSVRLETIWWGEALWCTSDNIFYSREMRELWHLNLVTGQSEQLLSGERVRLVGCLP
jgi:hypothetical protein